MPATRASPTPSYREQLGGGRTGPVVCEHVADRLESVADLRRSEEVGEGFRKPPQAAGLESQGAQVAVELNANVVR